MNISYDKRLELIFGLQYCIVRKYNVKYDWIHENFKDYNDEFYKLFESVTFKELEQYILNNGLESYGRCIDIALSLDSNFNIIENQNIKNIQKYNKNFDAVKLSKLLKKFVADSNYDNFYIEHMNFYQTSVEAFRKTMNRYFQFEPEMIDDYYGYSLGEKRIILLNFSNGSYGKSKDNTIYYINGHNLVSKDNKIIFNDSIPRSLFHEFSHPYINPLA